jgi:hypothetical protein
VDLVTANIPVPPPPQPGRMTGGRIALVVIGALAALAGFALLVGGAVLGWAHATQRDDDGFYRSGSHLLETTTYAITSERIDLGAGVGAMPRNRSAPSLPRATTCAVPMSSKGTQSPSPTPAPRSIRSEVMA